MGIHPINQNPKLEKINLFSVTPGDYSSINDWINSLDSGIALLNENSLVNLDILDQTQVTRKEGVNLDKMRGNKGVLSLINLMKSKKNISFFPGTLLRNYGHFFVPTMPIIINGELKQEKIKQTGSVYVDNYRELARNFLGQKASEGVSPHGGVFYEEPLKSLMEKVNQDVNKRKERSLNSFNINGLQVLPIICNEFPIIAEKYRGPKLDVLLHSCSDYFENSDEREKKYSKYLDRLGSRGKLEKEVILASSEVNGKYLNTFRYLYSQGKLNKIE